MAWWRKNKRNADLSEQEATEGYSTAAEAMEELGTHQDWEDARGVQPSPIPEPREADLEAIDEAQRWQLIKRDLEEIDPQFVSDLQELARNARPSDKSADLTEERLAHVLRRLKIRYLTDEDGGLIALWERHVVQLRCEGPHRDILVIRARAYQTVPPEWADRGYAAMNEWNRSRRFLKAYLGDLTDTGNFPVYGELQLPVRPGIADNLLEELIDCGTAIAGSYVDWLHGEGSLL
ncbi:YbjN domain-containing protein [Natronoglycomyces albus]|uniref:YbjN domain-containing protein n=1 Tax=Natronoglycomyces albus TaxID=2811108 RepID=A0A895XXB3_9ACTN|nr:YbjN domain-containing protein [Natronoglycomyces albus]QSB06268.1 YbjN domain-containing protein [Natronoglycomyces albus]